MALRTKNKALLCKAENINHAHLRYLARDPPPHNLSLALLQVPRIVSHCWPPQSVQCGSQRGLLLWYLILKYMWSFRILPLFCVPSGGSRFTQLLLPSSLICPPAVFEIVSRLLAIHCRIHDPGGVLRQHTLSSFYALTHCAAVYSFIAACRKLN